jgi:hypothetical protein
MSFESQINESKSSFAHIWYATNNPKVPKLAVKIDILMPESHRIVKIRRLVEQRPEFVRWL